MSDIKLNKHKLSEIRKRLKKHDSLKQAEYQETQTKLRELVKSHGIDNVSAATKLTTKTIKQYCWVTVAPPISRNTIDKAELILKDL